MKRWALVAGVLLLFSVAASAQEENPKVEVFGGYSLVHNGSNFSGSGVMFNGGEGSFSYNPTSWLGLVGDFTGEHWSKSSLSANLFTYLFGPKVSYRTDKVTAFGQVGFGGARLSGQASCPTAVVGVHPEVAFGCGSGSINAFAMSVGGGLDYNLTNHIGIRPVQLDYVMTRFVSQTQNSLHYGAGIVFRW